MLQYLIHDRDAFLTLRSMAVRGTAKSLQEDKNHNRYKRLSGTNVNQNISIQIIVKIAKK